MPSVRGMPQPRSQYAGASMPGALFTVTEVAAALRLSPSTVYRALQDGRVRGVRVRAAGAIRIPAAELARLLEAPAEVDAA